MASQDIKEFSSFLRAHGKQLSTVESYARDARQFENYLNAYDIKLKEVNPDTLDQYQQYLENIGESSNTIRRAVIGIRQYFRYLSLSTRKSSSVLDDTSIPQRMEKKAPELSQEDIEKIFSTIENQDEPFKISRDQLILSLLALEGLKASELIDLEWTDLVRSPSSCSLRIRGERKRLINCHENTCDYLLAYKRLFDERIRTTPQFRTLKSKMIVGFQGRDASIVTPSLSRHGLKFILYDIGEHTGLPHLNSETLRHHAIKFLLKNKKTVPEIMERLGLRTTGIIAKHLPKEKQARDTKAVTESQK